MKKTTIVLIASIAYVCIAYGNKNNLTQYVNPFIGTGGHGHTFPGVVLPNGMVQLSPDTRMKGWDACSGYHYSDSTIIGFTHTHLSGTGIGDYGDILIMPMVDCEEINRGEENIYRSGYRSRFSHNKEVSVPGYYSVILDDYNIKAELTATTRTGLHRYTFPKSDNASILLDLTHSLQGQANTRLEMEIVNEYEIKGVKTTSGWAKEHPVFFYAKFSKPFHAKLFSNSVLKDSKKLQGNDLKALLQFKTKENEQVLVKVGISSVDTEGAFKNLTSELPDWDFQKVVEKAKAAWNEKLSLIKVETKNISQKHIFYTALYHAMISPNIFSDVDGRYRAQNREIVQNKGNNYYTVFSLWDTYRALNPLLTIIDPKINNEFAATLVKKYEEGGCLPMWDLASNYTGTMTGYHAVSVIVEAYLKGARNFDAEKAFEACVHSSKYQPLTIRYDTNGKIYDGLMPVGKLYKDSIGYIPSDVDIESVAKGLEFAYNDWCIAQFAKSLGKEVEYKEFMQKSMLYKNYFDAHTGFMRGKMKDGSWRTPFDPRASNHRKDDYCEGNAWQWSWYVPHDVPGLVALHGGVRPFVTKLDDLFMMTSELVGERVSGDISGLIGQYAHGNEPSHHITHLYNYVGQSWKTQELVDQILSTLYFDDPNGLAGNEDCGQMSAWYILNAIGIYSLAPASGVYSWGRPLFDKVTIPLNGKKEIDIIVINNSIENKYIQSMKINGKMENSPFINYTTLMSGAKIEIEMGGKPNKAWGILKKNSY